MRWFNKHLRNVGIASIGILFLLTYLALIPLSAVSAHQETPKVAAPTTVAVQATPTVDATVTALNKDLLTLQVKQLQNQIQNQNNWLANNSTAIIAAFASVIVALFGIYQWTGNRKDERQKVRDAQDKDLKAQAEERFKTAVTALGDEKESAQVGGAILRGAILLRSFLNKDDKEIYERYYTQIFDLAVVYLRLLITPKTPANPNDSLLFTSFSQSLIVIFKEAFPLARDRLKEQDPKTVFHPQSLDASHVNLDRAYLVGANLKQVWMPEASLREANLSEANLSEANLSGANLSGANLLRANLSGANLSRANLSGAYLSAAVLHKTKLYKAILNSADLGSARLGGATLNEANLSEADLSGTDFSDTRLYNANLSKAKLDGTQFYKAGLNGANLSGADLSQTLLEGAILYGANLSGATFGSSSYRSSLIDTDLRGVKGLDEKQLAICKAKGAIIDGEPATSVSQLTVAPSLPPQSNNTQPPSAPPAQQSTPSPDPDGSSTTPSQPDPES
jgi:uncharacterized protein YjbI with pentapeptide repeats